MSGSWKRGGLSVLACGVLVAGLGVGHADASAPAVKKWKVTQTTKVAAADRMESLAVTGRKSAWASGSYDKARDDQRPQVFRWNGKSWRSVTPPDKARVGNTRIEASSDKNVWWFGNSPDQGSYRAARWNGKKWTAIPVSRKYTLLDTDVVSASDVWVLDRNIDHEQFLRHWNGKKWTSRYISVRVTNVDLGSARRGWLVGGSGQPYTLRWTGKIWKSVHSPRYTDAEKHGGDLWLNSVVDVSANSAFAVGTILWHDPDTAEERTREIALKWNGRTWKKVAVPAKFTYLHGLAKDGAGGFWMQSGDSKTLVHYRAGKWTTVAAPSAEAQVGQLANVPGTSSMLGVGTVANGWHGGFFATR
jgi:hypothetical protein